MIKLFIVLYVSGQVGGTWGPLPYGIEECEDRAEEANLKFEEYKVPYNMVCEYHKKAPPLQIK